MIDTKIVPDDILLKLQKSRKYFFFKRCMDITLSLTALIVLFPFLILTAIMIKIDSRGKVIFKQYRTGKHGKPFIMYKFRSMNENAESVRKNLLHDNMMDGPVFKIKNDPRITRFGKFIRNASIDELPQLINIIRGEMSIVGPRPLAIYETKDFSDYENIRHLIKPGLTCYWQVLGRNNVSFYEWIELDLRYIREMSLKKDIIIILCTVKVVMNRKGAF